MTVKYVIFKDDDAGKNLPALKKWIDLIVENNAKGCIGLIGKYLTNSELVDYLNSLDSNTIEIFCHGFYHSYFPFLINKMFGKRRVVGVEFDKNYEKHKSYLRKYRELEGRYLKTKALAFGPPGNIYNKSVFKALVDNDFKAMFSWEDIDEKLLRIPLTSNFTQVSLDDFIEGYQNCKDERIYTLQFHHSNLTSKHLEVLPDVIDFLKTKEKRVFINPSDYYSIFKK